MKPNLSIWCFFRRAGRLALILCLLIGMPSGSASAAPGVVLSTVYTFPADTYPSALVYGPKEAFWFTLKKASAVAQLNLPSTLWQTSLPPDSLPFDIAIGPDTNLWFTEQKSGKIGRIDAENTLAEFALADPTHDPTQIALGQDGGLWFTEFLGNRIGRIDVDGTIEEYALPNPDSQPLGIAAALDGAMWFTERKGERIGRIDARGLITEYAVPDAHSRPTEIALDPEGLLWFVYETQPRVVRLDPTSGKMDSFPVATSDASFLDLAGGPDGRLWLLGTENVSRITLKGAGAPELDTSLKLDTFVYDSQGRSQIIAGPGAEMHLINARSQKVQRVSVPDAAGRDLQVFIHPFPAVMLMGGTFEIDIEVANWSASPASDVLIKFPLPEDVHFLRADSPRLSCSEISVEARCQLAALAAGERLVVPFFFNFGRVADFETTRSFQVSVSSAAQDYLPANNHAFRSLTFRRVIEYFNDFNAGADSHWSHTTVTSPDGKLRYLGGFDNQKVTLTFANLPHHDRADLCFDLYVLGGWDGSHLVDPDDPGENPPVIGPDLWANYIDSDKLRVTTFSNQPRLTQSYPAEYNEGEYPAQTGAAETGNFDQDPTTTDSRYHFCIYKTHLPAELKYTFYGSSLDGASGEQWALDNVSVRLYYRNVFDWLYLPLLLR